MLSETAAEAQGAGQAPPTIVVCSLVGVTGLRATDGAPLWLYPLPFDGPDVMWPNLASGHGVIYLGVAARQRDVAYPDARVIALRARDGAVLWQTDLPYPQGPLALAVGDERVFALGSWGDRAVIALDARTGAIRWMKPNLRGWRSRLHTGWNALIRWAALSEYLDVPQDRGSYGLLAAHQGTVYASPMQHHSLHALDARTGAERWRSALRGSSARAVAGATQVMAEAYTRQGWKIADVRAADGVTLDAIAIEHEKERPLLLSERGVVYLMRGPDLCAVRVSDGRPEWRAIQIVDAPNASSEMALKACLTDHTLYYHWGQQEPPKMTVGAVDRQTGEKRWEWRGDAELARAGKAVHLVAGDGRLALATSKGLFAFDEHDGHVLWRSLPETNLLASEPALAPGEPA